MSGFMFETTPFEKITENLKLLQEAEFEFKKEIKLMLDEDAFQASMTEEILTNFNDYLSNHYTFFYDQEYKSNELSVLFASLNNFQLVLSKTIFIKKKALLDYQAKLHIHKSNLSENQI